MLFAKLARHKTFRYIYVR